MVFRFIESDHEHCWHGLYFTNKVSYDMNGVCLLGYQCTEYFIQFQVTGKSGPLNGISIRSATKLPFGLVMFWGRSAR